MKSIGILGGTGYQATISIYRDINQQVLMRTKGAHSANIKMLSVDYPPIKSRYGNWDEVARLLQKEVETLLAMKPDCFFIACNTLHKVADIVKRNMAIEIPFFHAVQLTQAELVKNQAQKILFLGTAFTMRDDYFTHPLRQAGLELIVPDEAEQRQIQTAQERLASEGGDKGIVAGFKKLLANYEGQGCTDVVLACTELPLAIDRSITTMRITDPAVLQCKAAVDFVLG